MRNGEKLLGRPQNRGDGDIFGSLSVHEAPHTRGFRAILRRVLNIADSLAERGGFEPPVPLRLTWAEFGPSSGHYYAQIRASVLERICSPGVRPCFGSLRFPSFARLMLGIWVTLNMR